MKGCGMCTYKTVSDLAFLLMHGLGAGGPDEWTSGSDTSPEADLFNFVDSVSTPSHKSNQPSPDGGSFGGGSEVGPPTSDIAVSDSESDERLRSSTTIDIPASTGADGEGASGADREG